MALLAPAAMLLYMKKKCENEETLSECEEPDRPDIIRGNYENKIRFFSPPEKIYEVFATERSEDGELRMSYKDFLRAMTPFCYTPFFEDTDEYLKAHENRLLSIVDADRDGTISFTEFFFFLVIYQIEPLRIRRVWKKFPDGKMPLEKASETLRYLRKQTQAGNK